jgi:diguanylate cyclase (GGDEF)-like protein
MPATKPAHAPAAARAESVAADDAVRMLTDAVNGLSLAEGAEDVHRVASTAARALTGADGAALVVRDGEHLTYVDEDAIEPLWKGERYPLSERISGWAMVNRRPAVIEDIFADYRVPQDAYARTFVKSLLVVPIRPADPVGAIGVYWARHHRATSQELGLTRALADSTAIALEHVDANGAPPTLVQSDLDPVTGLFNRRTWERAVAEVLDPHIAPLCVGLIAIDGLSHFRELHGDGDALLRRSADGWHSVLREQDLLARYGDEEFAVLLPECDQVAGRRVAERLCLCVPDDETASIGIAAWDGDEAVESLLGRAGAALHEAKASGPARIVVAA